MTSLTSTHVPSTYLINTPSQLSLPTHPLNSPCQPPLTHPIFLSSYRPIDLALASLRDVHSSFSLQAQVASVLSNNGVQGDEQQQQSQQQQSPQQQSPQQPRKLQLPTENSNASGDRVTMIGSDDDGKADDRKITSAGGGGGGVGGAAADRRSSASVVRNSDRRKGSSSIRHKNSRDSSRDASQRIAEVNS